MLKWFNMHKNNKIILKLFGLLFFLTPLILWPFTSEIFEFNKMIFVYIITTVVVSVWAIGCVIERRFIFRRTLLDIPILLFLSSQLISAIFSMDHRTSFLGYYSRFNGGLLSLLSYSILYWAFVSNMDRKSALTTIRYSLFTAVVVCIYGILQRFGIDKDIWVQDVQNRIFSTLGQPNWLAAFLVALIPLTWASYIKKPYSYILSALFFATILFTKSRSGLLGLITADVIFWGFLLFKNYKDHAKQFLVFNISFLILFFMIGSPFAKQNTEIVSQGTTLEVGGTESGDIRKIVWKGAIEAWKGNPIIGSGPETFAYIYPLYRPQEHNLVSEWDFIYNKAHNEYLNLMATTGTLGIISYLVLIIISIIILIKTSRFEFLAGYVGLLVSNFFGFSVVITQLFLFLFPAIALILDDK